MKACEALGTPRRNNGPNVRLFEASDYTTSKKFSAFKPGSISEGLRKALGMKESGFQNFIIFITFYLF